MNTLLEWNLKPSVVTDTPQWIFVEGTVRYNPTKPRVQGDWSIVWSSHLSLVTREESTSKKELSIRIK